MTNWPSRAEWAKARRTAYHDRFPDTPTALANYATPQETAALKAALRERWKELGRKARNEPDDKTLPWQRRCINRAIQLIDANELPLSLEDTSGAKDIFAPFHAKYAAARAELHERTLRKIEQTPIGDDAWTKELQRRSRVGHWNRRRK